MAFPSSVQRSKQEPVHSFPQGLLDNPQASPPYSRLPTRLLGKGTKRKRHQSPRCTKSPTYFPGPLRIKF